MRLTESQIRKIIKEELSSYLIQEGFMDTVKGVFRSGKDNAFYKLVGCAKYSMNDLPVSAVMKAGLAPNDLPTNTNELHKWMIKNGPNYTSYQEFQDAVHATVTYYNEQQNIAEQKASEKGIDPRNDQQVNQLKNVINLINRHYVNARPRAEGQSGPYGSGTGTITGTKPQEIGPRKTREP